MPVIGCSSDEAPEPGPTNSLVTLLTEQPFGAQEPLLCTIDREVSSGDAKRQAQQVASSLTELGVEEGQGVAVQLPSGPEAVTTMFGVWLAGAVFVPANIRQTPREINHLHATVRPAAVIDPSGVRRQAEEPASFGRDAAFITWTSGTTGPPKAILQTHSGYREILGRVLRSLRKDGAEVAHRPSPNIVPVSMALNAGIYNVLFGLMAGSAVVLMDRFVPGEFSELVRRYRIRSSVLPPAAMTMLVDDPDVETLSPLRYVRSITAPLSPLAARRFRDKFGVTVLNGYGQAEIGEVIGWTAADAKSHPDKLGAIGRPHPGVEIKVVGATGEIVEPGEQGELCVRPAKMTASYAGGEALDDRLDTEGYLRTGDYALVDEDGFVWLEGRASDLINRGGNKVFPGQVEEVLLLARGVREVAVVGVADARLGEVPVAFVVGDASDEELAVVCEQNLVPYKIPRSIYHVATLPRNEVGKVMRRQLADGVEQSGEGLGSEPVPAGRSTQGMSSSGEITNDAVARLRARIGIPVPNPVSPHYFRPGRDAFRHVAVACGDDNPLWCDPNYGARTVWGSSIASPVLVGGDSLIGEDELIEVAQQDQEMMKGDPLRGVHAFYSASAREWWAPLVPDRQILRRNALVGVLDKPSEFAGRAVHEWTAQVFQEAGGPLLAGQYRLMIRTERTKARERRKYDAVTPQVYTDTEILEIENAYGNESRRGAEVRWWEDVRVGDMIGPMAKGPLTVTDIICWHVGMGMGVYGIKPLRLGFQNRQRIPRFFQRDEMNVPDVMQRVHWDPEFARRSGNPTTFDYGRMRETWLIHLCTDWMGDDAWLWKLDCQFRRFNYIGDMQWLRGTVTRHYLAEGDRPAIELDLHMVNQRGEETTPGHATILLPSRERGPVRLVDPPGGATDLEGALDAISARFAE